MSRHGSSTIRTVAAVLVAAVATLTAPASAQNVGDVGQDGSGNVWTFMPGPNGEGIWRRGRIAPGGTERRILAERYTPTIWIDPDGCEHWVMDDGVEGYMTPHLRGNGRPVCAGAPKGH